ncbi:RidA family protein [Yaniella halotolerans]|uniref:RidA family protein n=1 Tax=Yaniella halotolerans TaxID=225453 RepID=UPI0003B47187|nr:RidA family protein [Yaniella halotolerans]
MSVIEQRIEEAGYTLPAVGKPLAAYVPTMRDGDNVYTSGQLPLVDGKLAGTGKVGDTVSIEDAAGLARTCVLNALAAIKAEVGDLDKISQITKVVGFVSSAADFAEQHIVVNGASEFIGEIFQDKGTHARSAVGVAMLPMNAPVEVEMIVKVDD